MPSHTQRTLEYIRKHRPEWIVEKAERWQQTAPQSREKNPSLPPGRRIDLFGFCDLLVMPEPDFGSKGLYAVQVCAGSGLAAHRAKITGNDDVALKARRWLRLGNAIILVGWRKVVVKRGGKLKRWKPRIVQVTLEDFDGGQ